MRSTRQKRPNFVSIQTKAVIKTPMISNNFLKAKRLNILSVLDLHHQPLADFFGPSGLAIVSRWHYSMLIDKLVLLTKVSGSLRNLQTWKTHENIEFWSELLASSAQMKPSSIMLAFFDLCHIVSRVSGKILRICLWGSEPEHSNEHAQNEGNTH